jgi:lambda repressor-like predicted transcriptional regulator
MKPLAEHGTTARAKGRPSAGIPGCPCPPCRRAENAYDKRRRFLNQTGRTLMVDTAPVAAHLRGLFSAGAGWIQLAAVSGCSTSTMHNLLTEQNPRCRRVTANKILAIQPGDAIPNHRSIPATGTIRRVRALMTLAHTCRAISQACRIDHSTLSDLLAERLDSVSLGLANRVDDGFRALSRTTGASARSRNRATRERWAPPGAWDDDTIDNPDAHPDWTGHCGTDRGWWIHSLEKIPHCQPCETAHQQWKTERAHLDSRTRWSELGRARGAAATREADLAADGRELLRYGAGIEQAAARLGVTKNHLQQALKRHPETQAEVAA